MKKILPQIIASMLIIISCNPDNIRANLHKMGTVSFGANYGVVNCPTFVTIYIDNNKAGVLASSINNITNCGQTGTITKDLSPGQYSYKVEIRPLAGIYCIKDLTGTFQIKDDECVKIFLDFYTINI